MESCLEPNQSFNYHLSQKLPLHPTVNTLEQEGKLLGNVMEHVKSILQFRIVWNNL